MTRDDFSESLKKNLAAQVASICSNPNCRATTSGPHEDPAKAVNLGVAAAACTGTLRRCGGGGAWAAY